MSIDAPHNDQPGRSPAIIIHSVDEVPRIAANGRSCRSYYEKRNIAATRITNSASAVSSMTLSRDIAASVDVRSRELSHAVGDDSCQLPHMLIQVRVILDVELNAVTVCL